MKLVTYEDTNGRALPERLDSDAQSIFPITAFSSIQEIVDGGSSAIEAIAKTSTDGAIPADRVRLLAPLPTPIQIRDVLCFLDHMRNCGRVANELQGKSADSFVLPAAFETAPRYYKANRMCVVGHEHDIQ
jgi:hypothetical protein|tara:strand:- start:147 stop:539 length:393 start_codon:yes stop_codon:yes gene_type:complete